MKIGAPTGTAAFLVSGSTLHTMLKFPIKTFVKKEVAPLSGISLKHLQTEFEKVELIVIDEKSMIGLYMLYMIDARLKEIKCCNESFGGISIIIMGDFAQLPPVKDQPMFARGTKTRKLSHYQSEAVALFNLFQTTIIFDEIMRQSGDDQKEFRDTLDSLASGSFNKEHWNYLKKRSLYDNGNFSPEEQDKFLLEAIMLCAYKKDMKEYNVQRMKALGTPIAGIKSINSSSETAKANSSVAQGLLSQMIIAKNAHVMLISNLWTEAGLTNGATGEIKYIIYEKGKQPPSLPSMIILQVPQYTGPSYLNHISHCIPMTPVTRTWYMDGKTCSRTMLAIAPAYAITIHKSQGMSLDKVIINIGNSEFANGLTYTAISRCRKIENLAFYPFENYRRFAVIFRKSIFKERLCNDLKEKVSDEKTRKSMAKK